MTNNKKLLIFALILTIAMSMVILCACDTQSATKPSLEIIICSHDIVQIVNNDDLDNLRDYIIVKYTNKFNDTTDVTDYELNYSIFGLTLKINVKYAGLTKEMGVLLDYPQGCKVNVETNGGHLDGGPIAEGEKIMPPVSEPIKANCVFAGWYRDSNFTEKFTYGLTSEKEITLYAKWIEKNVEADGYTFTLNSDNASYTLTSVSTTDATNIVIPSSCNGLPVTNIATKAFNNFNNLTSITIPQSVKTVAKDAFFNCYRLVEMYNLSQAEITAENNAYVIGIHTSLDTPSKITVDGEFIFYSGDGENYLLGYNGNKTELTLPEQLNGASYDLHNHAFYCNENLVSVVLPNSLTKIGEYAFYKCVNLKKVTIPDSVTSIERCAFSHCNNLTSAAIPDKIISIGKAAFVNCPLTSLLILPDSLTSIGAEAFEACKNVATLVIGEGLERIESYAFGACHNLRTVYWNATACTDVIMNMEGSVFSGSINLTSVILGSNVTDISWSAFNFYGVIPSLTIGSSFTGTFYSPQQTSFIEIYNLSKIELSQYSAKNIYSPSSGSSKLTTTDDGYLFYDDEDETHLIKYVGNASVLTLPSAFNGKPYEIYWDAFSFQKSLTEIIILEGVTSIGEYAFESCFNLERLVIPSSVSLINRTAFARCDNLTEVEFGGTVEQWNAIEKDKYWNDYSSVKKVICSDGVVELTD